LTDYGYIKLHRKVLEGGWLQNADLWRFWCWCLLKATHKPHVQQVGLQRVNLEVGQFVFGRKAAAKKLKMSEQTVRTLLTKLIEWQNLTIKPTNRFSVVTVVNWELYQVRNDESTTQLTNSQPTANQQPTTNKNGKNEENVKNKDNGPNSFMDLIDTYADEWSIDHVTDKRWFKSRVLDNEAFTAIDIWDTIEKWANWIEGHYRLKQAHKTNKFPATFKNSLTNFLKLAKPTAIRAGSNLYECDHCHKFYDGDQHTECPRCYK